MRLLHEHSAAPYLRDVRVPTLITAGTKDRLVPLATARRMQKQIAGSELMLVEGGTHYTPSEYPELLADRIRRFLEERVWEAAPHAASTG
jgi:pimeloyl-ACP methyl ester carboxylesterase